MTTRTPTRPSPTRPTSTPTPGSGHGHPRHPRRRGLTRLDLSATQLIATAFAAVTATVAGSFLGVSGTVLGAAMASVLSAIGNAVYTRSLRSTRDRVRAVVPAARRTRPPTDPHPRPARPRPSTDDQPPTLPSRGPRPAPRPSGGRTPWKGIAIGSIGVFLAVLAGVTVVEVVAGRPLADVVRGDSGNGTSLFGDTSGNGNPRPVVPTVTRTVTPSVVITTPTVTRTAPPKTSTVTPTRTVPARGATASTTPSSAPRTSASEPTSSSATPTTAAPTLG